MSEPARLVVLLPAVWAVPALVPSPVQAQDPGPRASPAIAVRVDPRVELLSVVFRLAGNPEYNRARIPAYAEAVDARFGPFRDHPAIQRARRLRAAFGVGYDACMSLAVHLPGIDDIAGTVPLAPPPETLDRRWMPADTAEFLRELEDFAGASRFAEFFAAQAPLYRRTEQRLREVLDRHLDLGWFDRFFGSRPAAGFSVFPGLLNGGNSYGPRAVKADGSEELFSILGVWQVDEEGQPDFDRSIVETVVHEFCHSYCNSIVERHRDELREAGEMLWPFVADTMRSQAYTDWEIVLKESLVRACTARYAKATEGVAAGRRAIEHEHSRGFEWTGELVAVLDRYEAGRNDYPHLEAFAPVLVEFFDDYARRFSAIQEKAPKVVTIEPAAGSVDVDPDLAAIVITFDRPMRDRSWSVVGGGPSFPVLEGQPGYDAERRVLTLRVRLEPDHAYEFWLNSSRHRGFCSSDGVPLRPVRVTFHTRGR